MDGRFLYLLAILVGLPLVVSATILVFVWRYKAPWLSEPTQLGELMQRLGKVVVSPKDIFTVFLLCVLCFYLDQLGVFLRFFWVLPIGYAFNILFRQMVTRPSETDAVVRLRALADHAKEADTLLRRMSDLLEKRKSEVSSIEAVKAELEKTVEQNRQDASAWENISEVSKAGFIKQLREEANRGWFLRGLFYVATGIALNLAATLIWVMSGNPGQEQIMEFVNGARSLVGEAASGGGEAPPIPTLRFARHLAAR